MKKHYLLFLLFGYFSLAKAQNTQLDSLKSELQKAKQDTTRLQLYLALGDACDREDNLLYAEPALQLADKILAKNSNQKFRKIILQQKIRACDLITVFYVDSKYPDIKKALASGQMAFETCLEVGDTSAIIDRYISFHQFYMMSGNYPKALEYLREGLAMAQKANDKKNTARCLLVMADMYRDEGENTQALENYQNALSILYAVKDTDALVDGIAALGGFYYKTHDVKKSLECYNRVIAIYKLQKSDDRIADVYKWMGDLYKDNNDLPQALVYYQKSLAMFQKNYNLIMVRTLLNRAGTIYYLQGNISEAIKNHSAALKIVDDLGFELGIGDVCFNLAKDYFSQKKYALAKSYNDRALKAMQKLLSIKEISEVELMASKIDSAMGNGFGALAHYKQYAQLSDSLKGEAVHKAAQQEKYLNEYTQQKAAQEKKDAVAKKELQRQKLVRNGFVGGFAVVLLFAGIFFTQRNKISKEKQRSENLLLNILPAEVAEELKQKGTANAKLFNDVTVLFTDFKSFTTVSERLTPQQLVDELHACFSAFDGICQKHNIEKIKTVGDAYLAVSGLPNANPNHAADMLNAAIEIRDFMLNRRKELFEKTFEIRIGIHSGSVVAGIVGVKKFAYDVWGDTVNTAARMEQNSEGGKINISETTYELVKDKFNCEYRGEIEAKNKGKMKMYFVG